MPEFHHSILKPYEVSKERRWWHLCAPWNEKHALSSHLYTLIMYKRYDTNNITVGYYHLCYCVMWCCIFSWLDDCLQKGKWVGCFKSLAQKQPSYHIVVPRQQSARAHMLLGRANLTAHEVGPNRTLVKDKDLSPLKNSGLLTLLAYSFEKH